MFDTPLISLLHCTLVPQPTPPQLATRILWEGDGAKGLDQGIGKGRTYHSRWIPGLRQIELNSLIDLSEFEVFDPTCPSFEPLYHLHLLPKLILI